MLYVKGFHHQFPAQQLRGGKVLYSKGCWTGGQRTPLVWYPEQLMSHLSASVSKWNGNNISQKLCIESLNRSSVSVNILYEKNIWNTTKRFRLLPHLIASTKSNAIMSPALSFLENENGKKKSWPNKDISEDFYWGFKTFAAFTQLKGEHKQAFSLPWFDGKSLVALIWHQMLTRPMHLCWLLDPRVAGRRGRLTVLDGPFITKVTCQNYQLPAPWTFFFFLDVLTGELRAWECSKGPAGGWAVVAQGAWWGLGHPCSVGVLGRGSTWQCGGVGYNQGQPQGWGLCHLLHTLAQKYRGPMLPERAMTDAWTSLCWKDLGDTYSTSPHR